MSFQDQQNKKSAHLLCGERNPFPIPSRVDFLALGARAPR